MTDKGFLENGFIVDLSNAQNAAEIIYELSSILDMPEAKNKKICLKLGNIDLSRSQLLSIKSLIESMVSDIAFIDTASSQTESSALSLGLIVSELSNKIEVPEIEVDNFEMVDGELKDKRIIKEFNESPEEGLSFQLSSTEETYEEKLENAEEETLNVENPDKEDAEEDLSYQVLEYESENKTEEKEEIIERSEKEEVLEISKLPTLYLQQNLRSGQTISYDGNITIIGDVHPGSEVIAKGDITIWGILGGIAHAGSQGNDSARIRALKMNAIQLRISGFYARRPDALNIPFIQRTNDFTPEEARVENKAIAIYKTYDA